jgi:hypothetical protein
MMKMLVGTAVLMAALGTGGITVVLSTVAQTDRAVRDSLPEQAVDAGAAEARAEQRAEESADETADDAAEKSAPDDRAEKRADALRGASGTDGAGRGPAKPADKDADGKPGYGPPAHARSVHNRSDHPGRSGRGGAMVGPSHGQAMRGWAKCVSGQAGNDAEGFDPEAACGAKPTPPGHLKQKATTKKP